MSRFKTLVTCGILASTLIAPRVQAATLDLSPATATIGVGDRIQVHVYGTDFEDGTDGGDFSLSWAPNLAYVGFAVEGAIWDVSAVNDDIAVNGTIESVDVFASTGTPGLGGAQFPIGRVTLEATAEGSAYVTLDYASSTQVGWSLDGGLLYPFFGPYAEIEVSGVPEPGTAAALAAAVGLLGSLGRARRRSRSRDPMDGRAARG